MAIRMDRLIERTLCWEVLLWLPLYLKDSIGCPALPAFWWEIFRLCMPDSRIQVCCQLCPCQVGKCAFCRLSCFSSWSVQGWLCCNVRWPGRLPWDAGTAFWESCYRMELFWFYLSLLLAKKHPCFLQVCKNKSTTDAHGNLTARFRCCCPACTWVGTGIVHICSVSEVWASKRGSRWADKDGPQNLSRVKMSICGEKEQQRDFWDARISMFAQKNTGGDWLLVDLPNKCMSFVVFLRSHVHNSHPE